MFACLTSQTHTMEEFEAEYDIFSPRWGHPDRYKIRFTPEAITISQGSFEAVATKEPNSDPVWQSHNSGVGNPFTNILENNRIYVSRIVVDALEMAWDRWKDKQVSDAELREGLSDLFTWVDSSARNHPTGFWNNLF